MSPSAPLHPLVKLREFYVTFTGDPYFATETNEPWFRLFLASEGLIQLPLAAYLVYNLSSRRAASGATELAAVVMGTIVSLSSAVCCYDTWCMGEDKITSARKAQLVYGTYLPFVIIREYHTNRSWSMNKNMIMNIYT